MFDKILRLIRRLYPTGRAWKLPPGSTILKLHRGLAASEERALSTTTNILNQLLPDNDSFTTTDAQVWESRLRLPISSTSILANRKAAIARKLAFPGSIFPRQHYLYLEKSLRDAGFPVTVHVQENLNATPLNFVNEFTIDPNSTQVASDDIFLYVTNNIDDDVTVYDVNTFQQITSFGMTGTGDGQFDAPTAIYAYGDSIYVCDSGNNRVQIFSTDIDTDASGDLTFAISFRNEITGLTNPQAVTANNDFIYIGNAGSEVRVYDRLTLTLTDQITGFSNPGGADVRDNKLFISDTSNDLVKVYEADTRQFITQFGGTGSNPGQFNSPISLSIDGDFVYVADSTQNNVSVFNFDDYAFVNQGAGSGLTGVLGMVVSGNYVYMLDRPNNRIQLLIKQDGVTVIGAVVSDSQTMTFTEHQASTEHGTDTVHGSSGGLVASRVVANYLDQADEVIGVQTDINLRSTFFIGGANFPSPAVIPPNREVELRDLILRLKPLHTFAYLLITFAYDPLENVWTDGRNTPFTDGQDNLFLDF